MSHQCQLRNFLILKPHPFVNSLPEMSVSKLGGRCKGEVRQFKFFKGGSIKWYVISKN
ncbi:hypothetical protein Lpp126_15669 [Lacticaseibacillus paracasei subsp. paracasei Lpp126]|uniref:Uncharacterized protein n=1 Tax=Lacticaseibacillus paracasei subsp. paracasei Lpp126 TaxID=1256206 RepID=S2R1R7_LACPA|nr:hypothetical protein Lpp126_15669 [Lacticaseibacillus paracasei subsp. paracasei Lpp126]